MTREIPDEVKRWTATPGSGILKLGGISTKTSNERGLISGEHYTRPQARG